MKQIDVTFEGPDIVIDLIKAALQESDRALLCPIDIHPGYILTVTGFCSE